MHLKSAYSLVDFWLKRCYNTSMKIKKVGYEVAKSYVIAKYLQELCAKIGEEEYLKSPIRLQHGTGAGGFGFPGVGDPEKRVGNSGSNDCLRERFRGITDGLGQRFTTIEKIKFRSQTCINLLERNRNDHRIEHTEELIDLYLAFEKEYIIKNKPFTAKELGRYVIENTLVCLIEQHEQKSGDILKNSYDPNKPFSKYSAKVFFEGQDVSDYNKVQLKNLTTIQYKDILNELTEFDINKSIKQAEKSLYKVGGHHGLPSMEIAVQYYNDVFSLLKYYYNYQLRQITDPTENLLYYNKEVAKLYKEWNEKLSMA